MNKTLKQLSKENLRNYLVDCMGYSEDELEEANYWDNKDEMIEIIERNKREKDCIQFNQ